MARNVIEWHTTSVLGCTCRKTKFLLWDENTSGKKHYHLAVLFPFTESDMDKNFYHTQRWKKLRQWILRRDGYRCQIAKRYGKSVPADTVHHIFPLEEYPDYKWCDWNLIAVSVEAHERLHNRMTRELTKEGMDLLIRTARKERIDLDGELERRLP